MIQITIIDGEPQKTTQFLDALACIIASALKKRERSEEHVYQALREQKEVVEM